MHQYRFVLVGDSGVGKTALLKRFADGSFLEKHTSTIGVDFAIKKLDTEASGHAKLQIWDTGGQERFRSITKSYYRGAQAIFLLYDVSNQNSFDNLQYWYEEIQRAVVCDGDGKPLTNIIIVGNKNDKEDRVVPRNAGEDFAKKLDLEFFETSAKSGKDVDELFNLTAEFLYDMDVPGHVSLQNVKKQPEVTSYYYCSLL